MNPERYQRLAEHTEKPLPQAGRLQHAILGITSEAGELADTVKKHVIYGQPLDTANLAEEVGDIMWYIALLCNAAGLHLGSCLGENIVKLQKRYPEKYTDAAAAARADKKED